MGDKTFRAGRRTAAHLEWTIRKLRNMHPGAHLHVIQPCYNDGVDASAGTHDKDCCLDVSIIGLTWLEAQAFLRMCHWAAWWRQGWQGFTNHIHMVSYGCPTCPVGEFVPDQIKDYFNHAYGLAGLHAPGSDQTWFPDVITAFDFAQWEREIEENMGYRDWDQADKNALINDIKAAVRDVVTAVPATTASAVWSFLVRTEPKLTARAALRQSAEEDK